jgi:hypothetical protein
VEKNLKKTKCLQSEAAFSSSLYIKNGEGYKIL